MPLHMAKTLSTSSHAVLGLLSMAPMSGYELAQAVSRSIAHFWPMSKTQVYSELGRLEGLGYIEGTDVAQERLPDKRVFNLTEGGERVLDAWLSSDHGEGPTIRMPALVKLFFAHRMTKEQHEQLMLDFKADAEDALERLVPLAELLGGYPPAAYARATLRNGILSTEACVAWADEVLADLRADKFHLRDKHDPHPLPEEQELAKQLFKAAPPYRGWRRRDQR
jgi:DNA-binding PadR family transcriptional regulator